MKTSVNYLKRHVSSEKKVSYFCNAVDIFYAFLKFITNNKKFNKIKNEFLEFAVLISIQLVNSD